jgi:hypothetical protein
VRSSLSSSSLASSPSTDCVLGQDLLSPCPYPAWHSYLPNVPYSSSSPIGTLLDPIATFLMASSHWVPKEDLFKQRFFLLDLKEIPGDSPTACALSEVWSRLLEEMEELPERLVGIFGLARHRMISGTRKGETDSFNLDPDLTFPIVRARPINQEKEIGLGSLRSSFLHCMVTVQCTVVRVSPMSPSCQWLAFSFPS